MVLHILTCNNKYCVPILLSDFVLHSVDNLRGFVRQFLDGEIEPHIKSEPIPEDNTGPVTVSNN